LQSDLETNVVNVAACRGPDRSRAPEGDEVWGDVSRGSVAARRVQPASERRRTMRLTTPLELIHELWDEHTEPCCPYLRHESRGCHCASPRLPVGGDPCMPCDTASLQLFCLTGADYTKCCLCPVGDTP
jgi:hypothetical protein